MTETETVVLDARPLSQIVHPRKFPDITRWKVFYFDPITRPIMQDAAHVWAKARQMGQPFTSYDRLDGDAILIAHTRALGNLDDVAVITENTAHLGHFVHATDWSEFDV